MKNFLDITFHNYCVTVLATWVARFGARSSHDEKMRPTDTGTFCTLIFNL